MLIYMQFSVILLYLSLMKLRRLKQILQQLLHTKDSWSSSHRTP